MLFSRPKLAAGLIATALVGGATLVITGPAGSAGAATVPATATAAATWLEAQITANSNSLPGFVGPDVGLTEDAVLALTAAGEGESAATRAATSEIASHITDFVSFDNFGVPDVHLAGALAKSLLVAEVQGADGTAFGGRNLESELRGTRTPTGSLAGRFADQGTAPSPDSSNGFSQALAVLALVRTSAGVPDDAVTFLLAQQCPSGAFRLFYDSGAACTSNTEADPDATGLAVQALAALPATAARTSAIDHAVTWLQSVQNPTTGSFSGSGPTANVPNTNSTGLAVTALRLGGATAAADKGTAYVTAQQLGSGHDAGAIGYDPAGKASATGGTIGDSDLDQFRRATSQAVLAMGLPSYGEIVAVAAAPTSSTTTTSSSSSSTGSTSSTSTSSTSSTSSASASSTVAASTTGDPTVLAERTANVSGLAATGGVPVRLVLFGVLALLLGAGLTVAATDRAAKHR